MIPLLALVSANKVRTKEAYTLKETMTEQIQYCINCKTAGNATQPREKSSIR